MLSLFQRKRVPPTSAIETPKGSMRPESAASLLATPRRQKLLEHIWQRTSLSRRQFATLYLAPLERYSFGILLVLILLGGGILTAMYSPVFIFLYDHVVGSTVL